jgi:diguanylate cyclase (GGDEF)-like protein
MNKPEDMEQLVERNRELEARVRELEEENLRWMHLVGTNRLTELPNSLMLYRVVLPAELKQGDGQGLPIACLLISPDGLGEINQEYGRGMGDQIIKEMALFLFESLGGEARLFHPDGSNFAILMLQTTEAEAREKAEQIQADFVNTPLEIEEWELTDMTCSVGVVTIQGAVSEDDVPDVVDQLYHDLSDRLDRAKQDGGDQIVGSREQV